MNADQTHCVLNLIGVDRRLSVLVSVNPLRRSPQRYGMSFPNLMVMKTRLSTADERGSNPPRPESHRRLSALIGG
jgi:hypothetical protein